MTPSVLLRAYPADFIKVTPNRMLRSSTGPPPNALSKNLTPEKDAVAARLLVVREMLPLPRRIWQGKGQVVAQRDEVQHAILDGIAAKRAAKGKAVQKKIKGPPEENDNLTNANACLKSASFPRILLSLSPALIVSRIKEVLACGLVAVVVSTAVYGITILQAYIYFRSSKKDSRGMRSFVALLFILDTISLALAVSALFEYVVADFGEIWLLLKMPLSLVYENVVTYFIAALTQCFFAHRLWAMSKHNIALVGGIIVLSFSALGPGLVLCVFEYQKPDNIAIASVEIRVLAGISTGLEAVCDIVILIALSYYLHSKRTGFKRTDSVINRLIMYAVNRGALTAICKVCLNITFVAFPGHFFHLPFALLAGKLYCNTLLATLNAQKALRADGDNVMEVSTLIINHVHTSTAENGISRGAPLESAARHTPPFVIDMSADNPKVVDGLQ
ncbi:hypothetical protein V8D89_005417 [Ganoderma adspersum]